MPTPEESLRLYDQKERTMRSALPVPEVQAFSTCTFDQIGWPHSVTRAADLVRYADWCNHPGANDYFAENAELPTQCASLEFTAAEVELLGRVADGTGTATRTLGKEVRPVLNHLAQIGPFRIIMEIRRRLGLDRLTVFDVGAGSGYQAAMQALAGNQALVTDNAQGLYLFQSQLLRSCCPGAVRDWVDDGPAQAQLNEQVHMIPWWDYLGLRKSELKNVDIFFCNNNLSEMNSAAASYTAFLAKQMMASSPVKMFFFTCLGSPKHSDFKKIDALLKQAGFVNVVSRPFWIYTLAGHQLPPGLFDFANDIPRWQEQAGEKLRTARDITEYREDKLPTDLDFVAFTGVFDLKKTLSSPARPATAPQLTHPVILIARRLRYLAGAVKRRICRALRC